MTALVIATQNSHKLVEFSALFPNLDLSSLAKYPAFDMPPETGETFLDNAEIKARAVHAQTGGVVLADDSGLSVDSLNGAPGVRSARYVQGTDEDRYLALLEALAGEQNRRARFVACLAIVGLPPKLHLPMGVHRRGDVVYVHGEVEGWIALEPRGCNGFGYDPIFELSDGKTMAQLSPEQKQAQSHRGNACKIVRPLLRDYFS